jgi:hypothetical protein
LISGIMLGRNCTTTLGNFTKTTFDAISETFNCLTPQPL